MDTDISTDTTIKYKSGPSTAAAIGIIALVFALFILLIAVMWWFTSSYSDNSIVIENTSTDIITHNGKTYVVYDDKYKCGHRCGCGGGGLLLLILLIFIFWGPC